MDTIVYQFESLNPTQLQTRREELISLATKVYAALFEKHLSEVHFNEYKKTRNLKETWDTLFNVSHCIACYHRQQLIGAIYWVPNGNPWKYFDTSWCYIRMLGVLPEFEGQGIGKKLTQLVLDEARSSGEKTIALHTSEIQEAAQHIYHKLGFVRLKELEPIWGKRYWLYTMSL